MKISLAMLSNADLKWQKHLFVSSLNEGFVESPAVVSCDLEITFKLELFLWDVDIALIWLLHENDLVTVISTNNIGSLFVTTILDYKIKGE